MAEDVSAYAINLAFQIQTATAIASLNDINLDVVKIQKSIEKISGIFAGEFKTNITSVANEFVKIVGSTDQISQSVTAIDTALAEALRTTTDQNQQLKLVTKELEKQNLLTLKMRGWQKELGLLRDKETVKHKQHKKLGEEIAGVWDRTKKNVKDTILGFADMLIGLQAVKATFSAFLEEENKFITANYRLYGSQEGIIKQVNTMTTKYGAMRGRMLEAFVDVAGVIRTDKDELGELAQQNQSYSLILGVNQKDMANWQRAMKGIGWSAQDSQTMLDRMVGAMRTLGLTTQQAQKLLNQQADSAATMGRWFGKKGTDDVNAFNMSMVGAANALNLPLAQVNKIQEELGKAVSDKKAVVMIQSQADAMAGLGEEAWNKLDEGQQQAAQFMDGLNTMVSQLRGQMKEGGGAIQDYVAEGQGLGIMSADTIAGLLKEQEQYGSLQEAHIAAGKGIEALTANMDPLQKAQAIQRMTTASLANQFTSAMGEMDAAWKDLWADLKPAMMWFIQEILVPIIHHLAIVVKWFSAIIPPVKEAGAAVGDLNKKAEPVIGTFEKVFRALVGITGAVWLAIGGIAAIGGAIYGMYLLWKKFNATLEPAKLWALAAAALAVGIAFFLIAGAFVTLAELGPKIEDPLIALVIVLGLVIIGLKLLSAAGPEVMIAAIAIAIVLVAVAFAAWLLAEAIAVATDALIKLCTIAFGDLMATGGGLVLFGILLAIAAIPILAGSILLAAAALPLAFGLAMLAVGLDAVGDPARLTAVGEALLVFGEALGVSSLYFLLGALALAAAAIPFVAGCAALYAGMWWLDEEKMTTVSDSMLKLGQSLELMSKYDIEGLPDIAGKIADFGESLAGAGSGLRSAALSIAFAFIPLSWAFQTLLWVIPVINRVMTAIADAIQAGIDQINDKMSGMTSMLSPLQLLMSSLNIPMQSLATEGAPDQVTAETVQTIKVKGDGVDGGSLERRGADDVQMGQASLLGSINDKMDRMTGGNMGEDVIKIRSLLTKYLPMLTGSPSKLGGKMTNWG